MAEIATILLGLTMGLTACSAFCLPYVGSWMLGREGLCHWADAGLVLLGRLMIYTVLGGVAAGIGSLEWLDGLKTGGAAALALASLLAGGWLLLTGSTCRARGACGAAFPPLLLGVAMGLTPCAPLVALLAGCALAGEIKSGLLHGALFGLSSALAPVILTTVLVGGAGQRLLGLVPGFTPWLRILSGLILIGLAWHPLANHWMADGP